MKGQKIRVIIHKSARESIDFLLNPKNTSRWIESIEFEETSETPVRQGTVFRNRNRDGEWKEYTVSAFEQDQYFEFASHDGNYHVLYSFLEQGSGTTEMEVVEWVDQGELQDPMTQELFEKLKLLIENDT